jgi:hypothetical protein
MSGDDLKKKVDFPKAEAPLEERARRLKAEVDRLASLPVVEWRFYLKTDGVAEKHGMSLAEMTILIEATIKEREKKAREDRAESRRSEQRAEKEQSEARREARREQERATKEAERARKEAERIEREQEEQRKKREAVFAEIADLPRMTHVARLKEAAARLREDPETLIAEFELFFSARSLPAELTPWPDPVDTAELLAGVEVKFRRYVVTTDAIAVTTTLYVPFTYVVEIARYAPKLLFQFKDPNAGKSTAIQVVRWMVLRPYLAIETTAPALYRIIKRLKPTFILDEADSLFARNTVLAHIVNTSWDNSGAKIPRAGRGEEFVEYDVFGTQVIGMKGLNMPDTTLSRCLHCMIWPKLPSEVVDDWDNVDDAEFVTLRRKMLRWSVDNAVALRAAKPEMHFNNRIRNNWQLLFAIADLAGPEWSKRARAAAIELESERDEPSEGARWFAAIQEIYGAREEMTSADLCVALAEHHSCEWADGISQKRLAVFLNGYRIRPVKVMSPTGVRLNGYRRAQFANAFARLLQKPTRELDNRTAPRAKPLKPGKNPRSRKG